MIYEDQKLMFCLFVIFITLWSLVSVPKDGYNKNTRKKENKKPDKNRIKVPNENYKKESELTEQDYILIDIDRRNTGIDYYSDEYYYNNILFFNYTLIED